MGLFSIFKSSKRVFFPGCCVYFKHRDIFHLYIKILSRLDIDFKLTEKKICCGLPALELGYGSEARKIARRNFEIFKEENIGEIITCDPGCYKMFSKDYYNLVPDWNLEVENIWKLILEKLELKPSLIKNKTVDIITYQDPCYFREFGIFDEVRKILELIGYEIREMDDSREEGVCCGNCGQLNLLNPLLSDQIAKERILSAKRVGVNKIITSSISDYEILSKNCNNDIEVVDISEILAIALGIKKPEDKFKQEIEEEEILDRIDKDLEDREINELIGESKG